MITAFGDVIVYKKDGYIGIIKYKEKEISFDIPLLVKASLSLPKLESKLIYRIDQLIR